MRNSEVAFWVFGHAVDAHREDAFQDEEALQAFLAGEVFTENDGHYTYTQNRQATTIVMALGGAAFGELAACGQQAAPESVKATFGRNAAVYTIAASLVYDSPVRLQPLGIQNYQFGREISQSQLGRIHTLAGSLSTVREETHSAFDRVSLDRRMRRLLLQNAPSQAPPPGNKSPERSPSSNSTVKRDPAVQAWVLRYAGGVCELCGSNAPFLTEDGIPFLEVHHVVCLANGGEDTVYNAVALCPNCHRECHYAAPGTRKKLDAMLTATVANVQRYSPAK